MSCIASLCALWFFEVTLHILLLLLLRFSPPRLFFHEIRPPRKEGKSNQEPPTRGRCCVPSLYIALHCFAAVLDTSVGFSFLFFSFLLLIVFLDTREFAFDPLLSFFLFPAARQLVGEALSFRGGEQLANPLVPRAGSLPFHQPTRTFSPG